MSGPAVDAPGGAVDAPPGGLTAQVRVRRPALDVVVDLDVGHGTVVCLLGPNGAGKSTVLGALAGLVVDDRTRAALDGRELDGGGRHVPPAARGVGVAFQDHRLFPHLSALENVAFGPAARGATRADAHRAARDVLARLGVDHLAERRPGTLSGGQAQRVALARALATEPRLLLLDEPLAALDAEARTAARAVLADVLRDAGRAVVLVSHDPVDAVALADRVVVVEQGRVVQAGAPVAVLADPWTPYVASLTGAALLTPERVEDHGLDGVVAVLPGGARLAARRAPTGPRRLGVPSDAVRLGPPGADAGQTGPPGADAGRPGAPGTDAGRPGAPADAHHPGPPGAHDGTLVAEVLRLEGRPTRLAVTLRLERGGHVLGAEVPWTGEGASLLRPGDRVAVSIDADRVTAR